MSDPICLNCKKPKTSHELIDNHGWLCADGRWFELNAADRIEALRLERKRGIFG